jgi:hypothetical protein
MILALLIGWALRRNESCRVENELGSAEPARGVTAPHNPELRMIG